MDTEEAIREIEALGLPAIFKEIQKGVVHPVLYVCCEKPFSYYDYDIDSEPANWVPLWETNGEAIVAYDKLEGKYIRYYYEDSPNQYECLGQNYQQFLTRFFYDLVSMGLWEELDTLSRVFGYAHMDEFRKIIERFQDEDRRQALSQLINRIS
ncbi:MAG: hypothetical protein JXR37_11185 [Kiritimatiellae bacterium]|nr:hypothetical protein [Kiritimatiellia bacterium]